MESAIEEGYHFFIHGPLRRSIRGRRAHCCRHRHRVLCLVLQLDSLTESLSSFMSESAARIVAVGLRVTILLVLWYYVRRTFARQDG